MRPATLAALLLLTRALPALAQDVRPVERVRKPLPINVLEPGPRRFIPIEFGGDLDELVRSRLKMAKDLEPILKLYQQFIKDGGPGSALQAREIDINNPAVQNLLRDWLSEKGGKLSAAQLSQLQDQLQKMLEKQTGKPQPTARPETPLPRPPSPPGKIAETVQHWIQETKDTELGEFLNESPAWHDTLKSIADWENLPAPEGDASWLQRLVPSDAPWKLAERLAEHAPRLPPPDFGRWRWPIPRPGPIALPSLSTRDLRGLPQVSLGSGAIGALGAVLVALLGWQAWKLSRNRTAGDPALDQRLGPWPVRPEAVTTRADLIHAFDYLALLRLGVATRSRNHLAIAANLAAASESARRAAQTLAQLYEAARYTPGPEVLPEAERDQARQALLALATGAGA